MSSKQLSLFVYDLVDITLPYLTTILKESINDQWSDVLKLIYAIAGLIFDSSYVNLYLVMRKSKDKFLKFVYAIL